VTGENGELPIADCRLPIADCRLPIADCRLPIADCRLPIADCRLPIEKVFGANCTKFPEFWPQENAKITK
jgi:hypothetical protein